MRDPNSPTPGPAMPHPDPARPVTDPAQEPRRSSYNEPVARTSSGAGGWIAAGVVAALLAIGAIWMTSGDTTNQTTNVDRPVEEGQTTIPGQTENPPTGSVTPEPAPAPAPQTDTAPTDVAPAPAPGSDTVPPEQPATPAPAQ